MTANEEVLTISPREDGFPSVDFSDRLCRLLEAGGILYFPQSPFQLPESELAFLRAQKQLASPRFKNVAYKPLEDRVTGLRGASDSNAGRLQNILKTYSMQTNEWLRFVLPRYANGLRPDYTSFRPVEEAGRRMRRNARNDLLHVDSFPTRPTYGDRIFRVFLNIHPEKPRIWQTSETFEILARTLGEQFKPYYPYPDRPGQAQSLPGKLARLLGLRLQGASAYDDWMSGFHNYLKANRHFQQTCRKTRWEFPPGSAWMVFTDTVSHSVLSGQYALEQTFLISQNALASPEQAPRNILEAMARERG